MGYSSEKSESGYGLYDGLVDSLILPILKLLNLVPQEQVEGPIRSFILDSLEMTTILLFLIVNTIMFIWLERKVSAGRAFNARGPVFVDFNYGHIFGRTWKFGLLQNIADFLKMFSKEDIVPEKADKFPFNVGFFAFIVAPPFILGALLPLGANLVIAKPAVGFLLIFALFSLYPIGVLITGWSSNNKYSLLGAFRSAAQMISYEIPLMLSVAAVVLVTNTFSLVKIAEQQIQTPFALPFAILMPVGFIVFMVALTAETERIPFDIPEAEAELVMGWRTELAGFRYMMSMATEYFILLIGAFVGIFLFWGGTYLPFYHGTDPLISFIILVVKLWIFVFLYVWVRGSLPRVRIDQLLDIGWKRLIPLAILNIIIVVILIRLFPQFFGVGL
ncbi:MAG: complex I subunit 1/NuoH family protein [Candidatus Hodarchaeales archaeon]|jgi:NAD(P)H-quinone oxidoreductase subunit 1